MPLDLFEDRHDRSVRIPVRIKNRKVTFQSGKPNAPLHTVLSQAFEPQPHSHTGNMFRSA